jgi:hypothetical protein
VLLRGPHLPKGSDSRVPGSGTLRNGHEARGRSSTPPVSTPDVTAGDGDCAFMCHRPQATAALGRRNNHKHDRSTTHSPTRARE